MGRRAGFYAVKPNYLWAAKYKSSAE